MQQLKFKTPTDCLIFLTGLGAATRHQFFQANDEPAILRPKHPSISLNHDDWAKIEDFKKNNLLEIQ